MQKLELIPTSALKSLRKSLPLPPSHWLIADIYMTYTGRIILSSLLKGNFITQDVLKEIILTYYKV